MIRPLERNFPIAVDDAAAEAICRRHAKSFYFASHFLPEEKRRHAYAVYAFCRLLDDAVDEAPDPATQEARLVRFGRLLDGAYAGELPTGDAEDAAALRAFSRTVRACGVPKAHFEELAEGCRMDLTVRRYADWPALELYCYRVAGVVGLIMCYVFGLTDPRAHRQAVAMGNAMQVTNILRDVAEDLSRGRVYLPQGDLARFGVTEADLAAGRTSDGFVDLMRFEIARARSLYAEGAVGLSALPGDGSRQTAAVMATVYGGILGAIERNGYDVFTKRAHLSTWQKIKRLPLALRVARADSDVAGAMMA
jgi:15-cis-phytoene synthase